MRIIKSLFYPVMGLTLILPAVSLPNANSYTGEVLATGTLVRPGNGGVETDAYCPPSTAAVGITISNYMNANNPYIYDFRLVCMKQSVPEDPTKEKTYSKIFVSNDTNQNSVRTVICPYESVITGLRMATNFAIKDIGIICARSRTGTITQDTKLGEGFRESLNFSSTCPIVDGKVTHVIGVYGYAAGGVDALGVKCGNTFTSIPESPLPSEAVLLGQYLPKGLMGTYSFLAATSTNAYVNLSHLRQAANSNSSSNTDVFPYKTSTTKSFDPNHFFRFILTPANKDIYIRVTRITYDSLTYPVGSGTPGNLISGNSATHAQITFSNTSFWNAIPVSMATGLNTIEFSRADLSFYPTVKESTEIRLQLFGATGNQYNDLSGRNGGQGLKIYGELIDNSPVKEPIGTTPKELKTPTNYVSSFTGGKLKVTVDIEEGASTFEKYKVYLLAPDLGYTVAKKLVAEIKDGKAIFNLAIPTSLSGKSIPIQLWSAIDSLESSHLLKTINIPKAVTPTKVTPTKKAPTKVTPTKKASTSTTVKCAKAGLSRTFTGKSCPPGWTKS